MSRIRYFTTFVVAWAGLTSAAQPYAMAKQPRTFELQDPVAETDRGIVTVAADEPMAPVPVPPVAEDVPAGPADSVNPGAFQGGYSSDGCSSCDSCCFAPCCCGPMWTIRAGAVFLHRNDPGSSTLATSNVGGVNTQILNANQLGLGTGWGYEIDAIRHRINNSINGVELRYFGVYGFNSSFGPVTGPGIAVQYANPVGVGGTSVLSSNYSSQLQNAELNLRRQSADWLQLIAGFRWVELADTLNYSVATPPRISANERVGAFNELFGAQVGADAAIWQRRRLAIDAIGKAGLFGNSASSSLILNRTVGGFPSTSVLSSTSLGKTAFVGELGLTGRYILTNCVSIRTTYQLLWLDGVTTATDQQRSLSTLNGHGPITSNTVFYNGAFIGLEYRN